MTDPLFFDTDCISAFLWVRDESLLSQLYPGRVVIPGPVYAELSRPGVSHLKARVDLMLSSGQARIQTIQVDDEGFPLYVQLTQAPPEGYCIIGNGEAASLVLAKECGGIVASNNLRDISRYVAEFHLQHTTTGDILVEALQQGLMTEKEGNAIWARMLAKRRKLGAPSLTDYLNAKKQ